MFEHLTLSNAATFLAEAHRVLKPHGIFRIVVPDMERAAAQYLTSVSLLERGESADHKVSFLGHLTPLKDVPAAFVSEFLDRNAVHHLVFGHAWMYDFWSLSEALRQAGFSGISRLDYQVGSVPELSRLDRRPDNSLHVECTKVTNELSPAINAALVT